MALVLADRVQETGTANTTVSFTLSGSVTGFQSFAVIGNTNTTYYSATDASGNFEVGVGTYSTTGPTLTRTTILSVTFGSGLFLAPVSSNSKTMLVSLDGLSWSTTAYPDAGTSYTGIYALAAGGKVVGVTATDGAFIAQEPAVISLYTTELTTL